MEAKEFKIPLILAAVGAALLEIQLVAIEKLPATDSMRALAIYTGINVALGIFGFIIAAKIFDISFGTLGTVCMKLAGTILISAGVAVFMPNAGLA